MEFYYYTNWFPIHYAAAASNYKIIYNILRVEGTEKEIRRQCDDGVFSIIYSTPLHIADLNNNLKIVLILLREGATVNIKNFSVIFYFFL